MSFIVVTVAAFLAAGLTMYSGFGLGTLMLPVFALFLPVEMAVVATALVHGANNVFKVSLLGRHADLEVVLKFGLTAIVAAVFGAMALAYLVRLDVSLNLNVNDTDHPLIIKVASIPSARIQVYFIDNDTYFKRKAVLEDADGNFFPDNDERSLFFVRGVLETVRKLGWAPDIIHCSGWMTSLVPLYLKHVFADEPYFEKAKVIYHAYDEGFEGALDAGMAAKAEAHGIPAEALSGLAEPTFENLNALGMQGADAVIVGSEQLTPDSQATLAGLDKPILPYSGSEGFVSEINAFYDTMLEGKAEAVAE